MPKSMIDDKPLRLVIASKTVVAEDICEFTLASMDGGSLPEFDPGAHVTIETPHGSSRRYSLINAGVAPNKYVIAVKKELNSRGGSRSMHDNLQAGSEISVWPPENSFPLADASRYLFIAGGIGITPILAMANHCVETGQEFDIIYCARSAESAAYHETIASQFGDRVIIHLDGGDPEKAYDFWDWFVTPSNVHVYCCGPKPLMEEVKAVSGHWPSKNIHFEDFKPVEAVGQDAEAFEVRLTSTGQTFQVEGNQSILETLRSGGVRVPSSCESGSCGSCRMKLVSGKVIHRDFVLTSGEYASALMVCVSRGDGLIEIDFES
jgi:phthalate 4,5-dioxygenase reductase subunit